MDLTFNMAGADWILRESILVIFPELSVCLLDATKPHVYDLEYPGDELLDLVHMCEEDAEAEEEISVIHEAYSEKMLDATGYMQAYAQAEKSMKVYDGFCNYAIRF